MNPELPDDIEQLKQMLLKLQAENQTLTEQNSKLQAELEQALAQLKLSRDRQFGKRSEKTEKGLFNEAEQENSERDVPRNHLKGRQPLPRDLPREERVYTLDTPVCDCCGESMHSCGFEDSEQVKIIPEKISVIRHRQTKYACRHCEQTQTSSRIITAPKPAQPIPRSIASPEALAAIVTAKYCDALPLYRQADILSRGGLEISRSTLADWCIRAGRLLQPLLEAMQTHLLRQPVLCADETSVQVLSEPGKAASSKSYMWVYRSGEFQEQPVVLYDYQPGRGREYPKTYLEEYSGYLLTDGYSVYDTLSDNIIVAGCWAHARRKFNDARKLESKKTGRATTALSYIQKLYGIERSLKELPPEKRREQRQKLAPPILDKFLQWLQEAHPKVLTKSPIGIAVNYTLNQWGQLVRYLESGELGIDNNVTERDIRPFTTGRKNWLFSKSVSGAKASAALYSIVMTCRANDLNPYLYFMRLFQELPAREKDADLADLMPWKINLEAE